jgi:hypothetical protein
MVNKNFPTDIAILLSNSTPLSMIGATHEADCTMTITRGASNIWMLSGTDYGSPKNEIQIQKGSAKRP